MRKDGEDEDEHLEKRANTPRARKKTTMKRKTHRSRIGGILYVETLTTNAVVFRKYLHMRAKFSVIIATNVHLVVHLCTAA